MPTRKLLVEIAGDDRSLLRTFKSSARGAHAFNSEIGRGTRGAIAASGIYSGLGRSLAFASASFLGGAGIVAAIKSTISAGEESQRVLAQTEVAVKNAGQSWATYGKSIEATALKQSRLSAFSDEELLGTFSNLIRRTGDVRKAFRLNALAADVARGRNINLQAATQLVIRASLGMAGALRRVGIAAKNGATGTQLLQLLQKKYAGAAAAYGRTAQGAMDRFRNAIDNVQEAIARGILPQLTQLLIRAADWLDNAKNQQKIVAVLTGIFRALAGAIKAAVTFLRPLVGLAARVADAVGGWTTALELAAGAWVGFKVQAIVANQVAAVSARVAAGEVVSVWRAALVSTGWGALALAAGAAAAYIITHWNKVKVYFENFWLEFELRANQAVLFVLKAFNSIGSHLKIFIPGLGTKNLIPGADKIGDAADFIAGNVRLIKRQQDALAAQLAAGGAKVDKAAKIGGGGLGNLGLGPLPKFTDSTGTKPKALTWLEKYEKVWRRLQLTLSQAQLSTSLQDDLVALKAMEASVREQLRLHKGSIDLEEKLVGVLGQERDLTKQIADNRRELVKSRQFRALGLTSTGDDRVAGVKALQKQLARVNTATAGTFLDTKHTRSVLARIRKVLAGGLGAVGRDVRQKVKEILDGINQQLKDHTGDQTKFRHARTSQILAGLGLSPEQLRIARARLAAVGQGGTLPGKVSPAFAGAGGIAIGTVHVHGVQNPRQFEQQMRKRQRSRPALRRGP